MAASRNGWQPCPLFEGTQLVKEPTMTQTSRFGTEVVATRSSRAYAEKYIASYADCLGETTYWDGQRSVPVLLTWEPVKRADGKWDVVATCSPREPGRWTVSFNTTSTSTGRIASSSTNPDKAAAILEVQDRLSRKYDGLTLRGAYFEADRNGREW